ncbi:unnamed protein product [Discosporangium mesarthrocarpum]
MLPGVIWRLGAACGIRGTRKSHFRLIVQHYKANKTIFLIFWGVGIVHCIYASTLYPRGLIGRSNLFRFFCWSVDAIPDITHNTRHLQ